ncbi:MAG TPA: hypothetical protein VH724_00835 [Candidatus Angelobacter sp.]|jgi:hypothetical protein|nr:hypothetical protein [Candidatus Angelobacter sp.]
MAKKTMDDVADIVMAYGSDPRNKFLTDPKDDESKPVDPALAAMPPANFTAFFADFTKYIRVDKGMATIVMTSNGLKACPDWASLILYVFNLQ